MSLLNTMAAFCGEGDDAEKAAFIAAMTKRIEEEGYKMQDLMFEVYSCQKKIAALQDQFAQFQTFKKKKGS